MFNPTRSYGRRTFSFHFNTFFFNLNFSFIKTRREKSANAEDRNDPCCEEDTTHKRKIKTKELKLRDYKIDL